jgi:hypothetical protein
MLPTKQPNTNPVATGGLKGLPQPLNLQQDDSSPLQKLLNGSRYRPSHVSNSPSADTPTASSGPGLYLAPSTLRSPAAVTAATRYDLDSSSFASLDVGSSTGHNDPKKITSNMMVTPSVQSMLTKPSFKPATLPDPTTQDELPAWLRMANEKSKRSTPTDFGKALPLANGKR